MQSWMASSRDQNPALRGWTAWSRRNSFAVLPALLLTSCLTSIGPTTQVAPGSGKAQAEFDEDRRACMASTDLVLQPVANRLNSTAARSVDQIRSDNSRIQDSYNGSFGQCMASKGNIVPGSASASGPPQTSVGASTVLDQSNSPPLSDADTTAAKRYIGPKVRELLTACPGETIAVKAYDAPLTPSRATRLLALTQPNGGACLGQPGEIDYLVTRSGSGWTTLLAAEPGSIGILPTSHGGYRDVELRSLGLCVYEYHWTRAAYAEAGSHDCPFAAPPSAGDVARRIRGK